MENTAKYYIVAAEALPEVFLRVAEAKRLLNTGKAATVGEATQMVEISRSAFYKYKDAIEPLNDTRMDRIVSFHALLKNDPGALSDVLSIFAGSGANILTIHQGVPANHCASVTISAEITDMDVSMEKLADMVCQLDSVIRFEILVG